MHGDARIPWEKYLIRRKNTGNTGESNMKKKLSMYDKRKYVIVGVGTGITLIIFGNLPISILGLVVGFAAMGLQYLWFRCPHCGIFIQLWFYKEEVECPQCGKKLGG